MRKKLKEYMPFLGARKHITEKEMVQRFAEAMVAKLNLRRHKYKRFGWRDPAYITVEELEKRLWDEFREHLQKPKDRSELVDIANHCFMLDDRLRQEENHVPR